MPSRCSITHVVVAKSQQQYGHWLLNCSRTSFSYSSASTLRGQTWLMLRLSSRRNILTSLFATSDFALLVAERNCDGESCIPPYPQQANLRPQPTQRNEH